MLRLNYDLYRGLTAMSFDSVSSIQKVKATYIEIAKKILIDKSSCLTLCIPFFCLMLYVSVHSYGHVGTIT